MISISCDSKFVRPGDVIEWKAVWNFEEAKEYRFSANLTWYTHGKGDKDSETAIEHEWTSSQANGSQQFRWIAPRSPCSFYGTLIKLNWQIEFLCKTTSTEVVGPIQISHTADPIRLPAGKSLKERFDESIAKLKGTPTPPS